MIKVCSIAPVLPLLDLAIATTIIGAPSNIDGPRYITPDFACAILLIPFSVYVSVQMAVSVGFKL
jgi:hypothetical protein